MTEKSPADRIMEARFELHTIVALLRAVSTCDISSGDKIDGAVVTWLADRVEDTVNDIEQAEMERRRINNAHA